MAPRGTILNALYLQRKGYRSPSLSLDLWSEPRTSLPSAKAPLELLMSYSGMGKKIGGSPSSSGISTNSFSSSRNFSAKA